MTVGIRVPEPAIRIGWKIETAVMLGVYAALNAGHAAVLAVPAPAVDGLAPPEYAD